MHRAIPFGPDAVMNLITDITSQRRLETVERYAKVAAHDLREPLQATAMFVEQLAARLEHARDEDNERLVDLLRRANARARTPGTASSNTPATGPRWSFKRSIWTCSSRTSCSSPSAALHDAGASVDVAPLPTIDGNVAQLSRVLQNLIANSVKFRSDEPARVTIAAEPGDGFWLFSVDDNGDRNTARTRRRRVCDVQASPRRGTTTAAASASPCAERSSRRTAAPSSRWPRPVRRHSSIRFSLPSVAAKVPDLVPSTRQR